MANNTDLSYIYGKILIGELIEKTNRCGISWDQLSSGVFKSELIWGNDYYDVFLTLFPNNVYILDFVRFGSNFLHCNSSVHDQLDDLYRTIIGNIEKNDLHEFIDVISSIQTCTSIANETSTGGLRVGGAAPYGKVKIVEVGGGIVVAGVAEVKVSIIMSGGILANGASDFAVNYFALTSRGAIVGGEADVKPYLEIGSGGAEVYGQAALPINVYLGNIDSIERLNPNGTLTTILSGIGTISDLAVDLRNGKIFWLSGSIFSCNLDGTNIVTVFTPSSFVAAIALDRTNQVIYYAKRGGIVGPVDIRKCNYNGTGDALVVQSPIYYTLDLALCGTGSNGYLMWTASEGSASYIYSCKTNGTELTQRFFNSNIGLQFGINTGSIDLFSEGEDLDSSTFAFTAGFALYLYPMNMSHYKVADIAGTGNMACFADDIYLPNSTTVTATSGDKVIKVNAPPLGGVRSEVILNSARYSIAVGKK